MTEPIVLVVKRYRCPHCTKTYSARRRTAEHMARCWRNPAVKCCLTCKHFMAATREDPDDCGLGVDLTAPCRACKGIDLHLNILCETCKGTRRDVDCSTQPITTCQLWQPKAGDTP